MVQRMLIGLTVLGSLLVLPMAALSATDDKPDELLQMVVTLIGDKDKELRGAGLEQVRTAAKGSAATKLFAAQLSKLDVAAQIGLLSALADRGDATARPAILDLMASSKDENVHAAAVSALGKLGDASDLPLLLKTLSAKSAAEKDAARESLAKMRGEAISKSLVDELNSASPELKAALLEVLATRRASSALPAFLASTVDDNTLVRTAGMAALGQFGRPEQLPAMLRGVLKATKGAERDAAEKNVVLVCSRIDNEDQRGEALIKALDTVSDNQRDELLSLVGRVGGKKLIAFVAEIATGKDAARRKLGIDALGKWPDASVADKLMDITKKSTDSSERAQAFQALVSVSAKRDKRTDLQRLDRMKQAMKLAQAPDEQKSVIKSCRNAYDIETVRFVLPYVDQPQFAQIACETLVELAHHREIRDPNKAEFDKVLDKVIAVSKDAVVVERANIYKRGETYNRK